MGSILTIDNLVHRDWVGDERCRFCPCKETINHLFFQCGIARFVLNVVSSSLECCNEPRKTDGVCGWFSKFKDQVVDAGLAAAIWRIKKEKK
jgi:hypothetical protein